MKKSIHALLTVAMLGVFSLAARAEPAVKLLVVDMAKLYDTHYKTVEKNAQIQSDDQKAQEEVDRMNKEGTALVDEYKALNDQTTNPALTADAKAKAQNDAQKKFEAIQNKQREVQTFIQNTRNALQQRLQTFRNLMLEEIGKVAADVAKRHGATLLLDKAGPSLIGISNVVYVDPGFDITDEVAKEINKDRPAATAAAPAASTTPAATAPAAPGAPTVTLPGVQPKK